MCYIGNKKHNPRFELTCCICHQKSRPCYQTLGAADGDEDPCLVLSDSDYEADQATDGMQIYVKNNGVAQRFFVRSETTVHDLKALINLKLKIPMDIFFLSFAGKLLSDDGKLLTDYAIVNDSRIVLDIRGFGGAGVKKQNLKLKKVIKKIYAPQAVDAAAFIGVEEAVRRISASQNFGAEQVLKSMSDEGLVEFRTDIESGKAALEKRVQTASKHTKEGIMLTKVIEVLEETAHRLESLVASALTEKFDNVHALLSAVDVEIGRRQARNI
jgi:hypothetical protein